MKTYLIFKKDTCTKVLCDSMSAKAAILNIIWILYHRLWHLLAMFLLYTTSLSYLYHNNFIQGQLYKLLISIVFVYLYVYGNYWRQKKFLRNGYKLQNVLIANNEDEALYKAL